MDYFEYHFVFCKDEKPFIADLLPTSLAECGFDSFPMHQMGLWLIGQRLILMIRM